MLILSICGGSGSGKSTLGKCISETLGTERVARIPADFYLKSNHFASLDEFFKHPLEYDWELIEEALQAQDGQVITVPDYDFIDFQRLTLNGCRSFVMRPVVIIDGMIPYPKADVVIFLAVPDTERIRRIIERDKVWKTQVIRYWEQHQLTLEYVKNLKITFDMVLDGRLPTEQNAKRVTSFLTHHRYQRLTPQA